MNRTKEFFTDITAVFIGLILFIAFVCNGCKKEEEVYYNIPTAASLSKRGVKLPNLVPIGIENKVLSLSGEEFYTGWEIVDLNRWNAFAYCVLANYGETTFVSEPAKNYHFIYLKWAQYDTVTGELSNCQEYWKDYYDPWGSCIYGYPCLPSGNGKMPPNTFDMYQEFLDSIDLGHVVVMVVYNADGQYAESNYRDNTYFFGFDWEQNPVCPYPVDHPLACFNGYVNNRHLTNRVKAQLKNMK